MPRLQVAGSLEFSLCLHASQAQAFPAVPSSAAVSNTPTALWGLSACSGATSTSDTKDSEDSDGEVVTSVGTPLPLSQSSRVSVGGGGGDSRAVVGGHMAAPTATTATPRGSVKRGMEGGRGARRDEHDDREACAMPHASPVPAPVVSPPKRPRKGE